MIAHFIHNKPSINEGFAIQQNTSIAQSKGDQKGNHWSAYQREEMLLQACHSSQEVERGISNIFLKLM